ncbi:MAG TPA: glycosyltransferase family 4 protein [Terriglobales bacterium]|nr:glycosyltransferase family 4 protein [Terriglobales bacterium]
MSLATAPPPWVIVCGGFHRLGGMDRANLALAQALIEQGREVFLVGHKFDSDLLKNPRVHATVVPRPFGVLMAENSLRRAGLRVAAEVTQKFPGARVVVNGGNCPWPDINWVHSVHAAWPRCDAQAPVWFRAKSRVNKQKARQDELYALRRAKLVIANSERSRCDLIAIGIPAEKIEVIYLGCEPEWKPPLAEDRSAARKLFGVASDVAVVSFVGALGYDRNKGFDTLIAAWREARLENAILIAAGGGGGFEEWQREIDRINLSATVRLLGFTDRVGDLLAASDLFVSPVRYEAFGLNVLEAICRGVPAIVSKSAGVAELYPKELEGWLLEDAEDAKRLREKLSGSYSGIDASRSAFADFAAQLRTQTMNDTAGELIAKAERYARLDP